MKITPEQIKGMTDSQLSEIKYSVCHEQTDRRCKAVRDSNRHMSGKYFRSLSNCESQATYYCVESIDSGGIMRGTVIHIRSCDWHRFEVSTGVQIPNQCLSLEDEVDRDYVCQAITHAIRNIQSLI